MFPVTSGKIWLTLMAAASIVACGNESGNAGSASTAKSATRYADAATKTPGKPSAPVSIDYEVLGKAIIGLPVAVNLRLSGTRDNIGPVTVTYSINDASALLFQEGQVERIEIADLRDGGMQQLAVVPQREGRLYINVSVEVTTPGGSMIKSMAIPIQVGSAPQPSRTGGELKQGPDGETVMSMPGQEN